MGKRKGVEKIKIKEKIKNPPQTKQALARGACQSLTARPPASP
jgi:hypothetical protein